MKLPVVALRDMTVLPGMLMHFDVSREKSISAAEYAMNEDRQIFLTCQKDENTEDPEEEDLFRTGTVGTVQQIMKLPDGIIRVLVKGKERAILKKLTALEPCLMGEVELMPCCRDVVEGRTGSDDPYTEGWHPGVCAAEPCIRRRRSEVSAYLSDVGKG